MRWPCRREGCTFGDSGVCGRAAEFTDPETECDDYLASQPPDAIAPPAQLATFPSWSGNALGPDFAGRMDLANPPLRVLVAGQPLSGKTSLVTAQFLDLDRTPSTSLPAQFAGSYTLYGYDRLCDAAFRWKEGAGADMPHTGRGAERDPAWLHLAFKFPESHKVRHLLLSDMPGELFNDWCGDKDGLDPSLIVPINVFWVVVDASRAKEKLQRSAARDLLGRVGEVAGSRRVEVILTKSDQVVRMSKSTKPESVLDAVADLVGQLRHAWTGTVPLQFTPLASYDGTNKKAGWRTLEPIRHLLEPTPKAPLHRSEPVSDRYVDFMGMGR